jgi:hypothetical protein
VLWISARKGRLALLDLLSLDPCLESLGNSLSSIRSITVLGLASFFFLSILFSPSLLSCFCPIRLDFPGNTSFRPVARNPSSHLHLQPPAAGRGIPFIAINCSQYFRHPISASCAKRQSHGFRPISLPDSMSVNLLSCLFF